VVRKRVIVSGLVQGVFFRDTCRRVALQHGVAGWVRNRPDGTVEAVFEGPDDRVDRLVEWARRGPSRAIVSQITVDDQAPEGLSGFAIR
jgi:acylphosphatase